ncbi:L7Ae/L30e/S12e/Gadd45 family ribosomal protein [Anaerobranca gottschalkii]|uniref:Ribosomal protein L7Ae n=1 Tax=Anaerobranca gottschalkii DSM 13577 TaxID=1120990 RepID=A0A1H9ZBD0_9FIRM|nr:ribosomal L7Ae/L30e/S12e/Gadd45 family protein [Anaerobranca gottschalkii]SES78153.1 Ribosomal protein L7Ae [Anaerobranca gottschalkii DSM 13577]
MNGSNNNYIASLLGLAQRARKLSSGTVAVLKAIEKNNAKLVIIANDISDNSIEKIINKCKYKRIPMIKFAEKATLGHYIGKELRAVISINDQNFATTILKKWEGEIL